VSDKGTQRVVFFAVPYADGAKEGGFGLAVSPPIELRDKMGSGLNVLQSPKIPYIISFLTIKEGTFAPLGSNRQRRTGL